MVEGVKGMGVEGCMRVGRLSECEGEGVGKGGVD